MLSLVSLVVACNGIVNWSELQRGATPGQAEPSGIAGRVEVSLGIKHACATLADFSIACWGANEHGQLGLGHTDRVLVPTRVPNVRDVRFLSVGRAHTCVVSGDGEVSCWGSNESAQLGIGPADSIPHPEPQRVGCSKAKKVQASKGHTCIETLTKTAECWGANQFGQLGDGTTTQRSEPTRLPGLTGIEKLSAGDGDFTCAVASNPAGGDAVYCWGLNDKGQIGQPLTTTSNPTPTIVAGITDPDKVFIGVEHACATLSDTTVECWGSNEHGQLGDGTSATRFTPAKVKGVIGMTEVAPGVAHTCGTENAAGVTKCWGSNEHGQIGLGEVGGDRLSPTRIAGEGWETVTADGDSSCGTRGTTTYCWGRNDEGQLGDGTTEDRSEPTPLAQR